MGFLLLAMQIAVLLSGCMGNAPPRPPTAPSAFPGDGPLGQLLGAQLEAASGPDAVARVRKLLGGDDPFKAPAPPSNLGELVGRILPEGLERLPVPTSSGDNPLAAALQVYGAETGSAIPSPGELAALLQPLELDREGQRALARLVLAYTQALRLQGEAVAALTPEERMLAAGDPSAGEAWLAGSSGRTPSDLGQEQARLLDRVRFDKTLQAADLLSRTVEAVRGVLARAPANAQGAPAAVDPWTVLRALVARADPPRRLSLSTDLTLAQALPELADAYGLRHDTLPPSGLPPSLDHAVALLVQAKANGARSGDGATAALALLNAAQAVQPTLEAWAAVMRLAQATAAAAARDDPHAALGQAVRSNPTPASVLAAHHGRPAPVPAAAPSLATTLAAHGMGPQEAAQVQLSLPPSVAAALALLLDAHGQVLQARKAVFSGLDPWQSAAVERPHQALALLEKPWWNRQEAAFVQAWAEGMERLQAGPSALLQEAQEQALAQVSQAAELLKPLQGRSSAPSPPAVPSRPQDGHEPTTPQPPPLPQLPVSTPTVPVPHPQDICPSGPFSNCVEDVWLRYFTPDGLSIVVTGFGSTRLDRRVGGGVPDILLDLGGDDTYAIEVGVGVGVAQPLWLAGEEYHVPNGEPSDTDDNQWLNYTSYKTGLLVSNLVRMAQAEDAVRIALDASGNDRYEVDASLAEGAGVGVGALGVLWDLGGDDHYLQAAGDPDEVFLAQGAGTLGGTGVLVDGGGNDTFEAQGSIAQGVAAPTGNLTSAALTDAPSISVTRRLAGGLPAGSAGLLLDLGPGSDRYLAAQGQGYSDGVGTVGVLVDLNGTSEYIAASPLSQGGRGKEGFDPFTACQTVPVADATICSPTIAFLRSSGLAALVDLGGRGDFYSADELPPEAFVFSRHGTRQRQEEAVWLDPPGGANLTLAVGIDSSLKDNDGNQVPDLVDVLAGRRGEDAQELLLATVSQAGATAKNATSDPGQGAQGFLFDDRSQCAWSQEGDCQAADNLDRYTCVRPQACLSVLTLSGSGKERHDHPALVSIDLGGDDTYVSRVAGTYIVPQPARRAGEPPLSFVNITGFSLDVGGSDAYATPTLSDTQGSNSGTYPDAALLLDLRGNDTYQAGMRSQGAAPVPFNLSYGVALLADLGGNDTYAGGEGSQAQAIGPGAVAALVDWEGDDAYVFERQAVAVVQSIALFLDRQGRDSYSNVTAPPLPLPTMPREAFASQGFSLGGAALFVDVGQDQDTYQAVRRSGTPKVDLSSTKNDVVLRCTSEAFGCLGRFSDNPQDASEDGDCERPFADNHANAVEDGDCDGVPGWLELVAGTDPKDPGDFPGSAYNALVGCASLSGVVGCQDRLTDGGTLLRSGPLLASLAGNSGIPLAQGLIVGGRGNAFYSGSAPPFLVDLGGNDIYAQPNLANSNANATNPRLGNVTLVLDLGAGNDRYVPGGCEVNQPVVPNTMLSCSGLGAATLGVSLLGDEGGDNRFEARARVAGTVTLPAPAASIAGRFQGAGENRGVGILASWGDGRNWFNASVSIDLARAPNILPGSPNGLTAATFAQGMGRNGGVGILASFGVSADTYNATAAAHVREGDGSFTRSQNLTAGSQGAGLSGTGILFDGGGKNQFLASAPLAQASARGAGSLGILWSGTGDDAYLANSSSQASVDRVPTLGSTVPAPRPSGGVAVLVDQGGSDSYRLARSAPGNGLGQGSGGGAMSLDVAGNDLYEARSWSRMQGSDNGVLADLAGDDTYRAFSTAQGAGSGLLIDLAGKDGYILAQGPGHDTAIDVGGDYFWIGGSQPRESCVAAAGRSCAGVEGLAGLASSGTTVDVDVSTNPQNGQVGLTATILPGQGMQVDRVAFLARNDLPPEHPDSWRVLIGEGSLPQEGSDGVWTSQLTWDTRAGPAMARDWPEGTYRVTADAFLSPERDTGRQLPDYVSKEGPDPPVSVVVDNPPTLVVTPLQLPAGQPGIKPGQAAWFTANVSADQAPPPASCAGKRSGAQVTVWGELDGQKWAFADFYVCGGSLPATFSLTGLQCAGKPMNRCPDGRYAVTVEARDTAGALASWPSFPLLVDSTPPVSGVGSAARGLPPFLGRLYQPFPTATTLQIPAWSNDLGLGLKAEGVAGIGNVTLLQLKPSMAGGFHYDVEREETKGGGVGTWHNATFLIDATGLEGTNVYLAAVAGDRVGNQESRSQKIQVQNVAVALVDLTAPTVVDVRAVPSHVRPGAPIVFNATLLDGVAGVPTAGVARAVVQVAGFAPLVLANTTAEPSNYVNASWGEATRDKAGTGVEGALAAELMAIDHAQNVVTAPMFVFLDDVDPRVTVTEVRFQRPDGKGSAFSVGRPGMNATLQLAVEDPGGLQGVWADWTELAGPARSPCFSPLAGSWSCSFVLPGSVPDGNYTVRLNATDLAGNADRTPVPVQVFNGTLTFTHLPVVTRVTPDSLTVHWQTAYAASTALRYDPYGVPPLQNVQAGDDTWGSDHVFAHNVTLHDLDPGRTYYFEAVSTSGSGSTALMQSSARTLPSYHVSLSNASAEPRSGRSDVTVRLANVAGLSGPDRGPVHVLFKVQEVGSDSSPTLVATNATVWGPTTFSFDTAGFPDGRYRFVLNTTRGLEKLNFDGTEEAWLVPTDVPPLADGVQVPPGSIRAFGGPLGQVATPGNSASLPLPVDLGPVGALRLAHDDAGTPSNPADDLYALNTDEDARLSAHDLILASASAAYKPGTSLRQGDPLVGRGDAQGLPLHIFALDLGLRPGVHDPGDLVVACASHTPGSNDVHPPSADGKQACLFLSGSNAGRLARASNLTSNLTQAPVLELPGLRLVISDANEDGRFTGEAGEFTIDATPPVLSPTFPRPEAVVGTAQPVLRVQVIDPLSDRVPDGRTFRATLDGMPLPGLLLRDEQVAGAVPPQRAIAFQPTSGLSNGRHEVGLSLRDAAGNLGQARWNFTIDTQSPRLNGTPALHIVGGWAAARPGANVTISLNATDTHGVAAVRIDVISLGGGLFPLAGPDPWQARFQVPLNASDGTFLLPLRAVDAVGNEGVAGQVSLQVDGTPPRIARAEATAVGMSTATIRASAAEPSTLEVRAAGVLLGNSSMAALGHEVPVRGLLPGQDHTLEVRAIDLAGNQAVAEVRLRTVEDTTPPSAPENLVSFSTEEGVVELRWGPATDDAGVAAYAVTRDGKGAPLDATLPANKTVFRDTAAPAGAGVTYRVAAIDLAGLRGPEVVSEVVVLALPHLSRASITPERGTTADPFTASVTYRSPSGRPADGVELVIGNTTHSLRLQGGDCLSGCVYSTQVHLPATSLALQLQASFRAATDGRTTELPLDALPAVRAGPGLGAHSGQPAPMPAAALQALVLLGLAFLWRRPR